MQEKVRLASNPAKAFGVVGLPKNLKLYGHKWYSLVDLTQLQLLTSLAKLLQPHWPVMNSFYSLEVDPA